MRSAIFLIFTGLMMISFSVYVEAETFHEQVTQLMESLFGRIPVPSEEVRVYIQSPKYLSSESGETDAFMGGGFVRHFRAACGAALRPPFYEIPRDDLDQIWSEVKVAQVTEAHDPGKVLQSLESLVTEQVLIPIDGIIMLECSFEPGNSPSSVVYVSIYFLDVRKVRKYTEVGEIQLTSMQVSDVNSRPQNYQRIPEQIERLDNIVSDEVKYTSLKERSMFNLFVNVGRGAGGVYQDGEAMTIHVSSELDCYIAMINVNVNGEFTLLFPNRFERNNLVRAGQARQIPGPEPRRYDLTISPPFGIETIKVIASRTPFPVDTLIENSSSAFVKLGTELSTGTRSIRTLVKSVMVQERPVEDPSNQPRFAEAMCLFTTMPIATKGLW